MTIIYNGNPQKEEVNLGYLFGFTKYKNSNSGLTEHTKIDYYNLIKLVFKTRTIFALATFT